MVSIDGHDVTRAIRTPDIDKAATSVARLPKVREALVARQRTLGADGGVVMEGRDIGTVVSPECRRRKSTWTRRPRNGPWAGDRRCPLRQPGRAGGRCPRLCGSATAADTTRSVSPLSIAPDAVHMDTTGVPIDQVVSRVMELVNSKTRTGGTGRAMPTS